MVFDIESFYPSISEKLFNEAIEYAKNIVEIPDHDMVKINHSRKSLIFHENEPLVELVGLLMLSKLVHLF